MIPTRSSAPARRAPLAVLLATLAATVTAVLVAATPAMAAPDVSEAAEALRSGAPVYNDPAAENALTGGQTTDLADEVLASDVPMFIAVLPESASGGDSADATLVALKEAVGLSGVYAVIVGDQFRAGSTSGSASDLATQAFRSQGDAGAYAVLSEFVALTSERFGAGSTTAGSSANEGGGTGALVFLLVMVIGGALVVLVVVRRGRKRQQEQLAAVRTTIDEDVTEYGERLGALDVEDPDLDDAARTDLQRALDSYDRAKTAADRMRRPADAVGVTTALEDGRYALACVDARLDQRPLPERLPPCFVDPRHGPSVAEVEWAPPGLAEREVPMCKACAATVLTGGQPQGLEVATSSGRRPYYQAGPEYGAYAQGYYSPFAGVMTAVVMGTMLSSMWHVPGVTSSGMDAAGFGGGGDFGGGGGGFGGGGDFGGGGFGGGDF